MKIFLTIIIIKRTFLSQFVKVEVDQDSDLITQQERGQTGPLVLKARKQHWPVGATHITGPPHCCIAIITPTPATPVPTSPRPARTGPRLMAATPLAARRAKPPVTMGKLTEIIIIINLDTQLKLKQCSSLKI